jgi:dihydrofolate synthase/folylpolyglutamate synthase
VGDVGDVSDVDDVVDVDALRSASAQSAGNPHPALARMRELLRKLGNPEKHLRFVHVAGTNGKGSVAAMIAGALTQAGYKTGLYTSPYIHDFNERIRVDGAPIAAAALADVTERVRTCAETMAERPTGFEKATAMAFLHFSAAGCEIVVLEAGRGGRRDATNVIGTPEAAVVTKIALDHMAELGDSIERIAREKAGIIKSGGMVISGLQDEAAARVIQDTCAAEGVRPRFVDANKIVLSSRSLDGQRFDFGKGKDYEIPLLGDHQLVNAAIAVSALEALRDRGYDIPDTAIRRGLQGVRWPGRFEILRRDPTFIVDGAHNPDSVSAAVNTFSQFFPDRKALILFGVLDAKDYAEMATLLLPIAKRFFVVSPDAPNALPAAALAGYIRSLPGAAPATAYETPEAGAKAALCECESKKGEIILSIGSLYLAGAVRKCLG